MHPHVIRTEDDPGLDFAVCGLDTYHMTQSEILIAELRRTIGAYQNGAPDGAQADALRRAALLLMAQVFVSKGRPSAALRVVELLNEEATRNYSVPYKMAAENLYMEAIAALPILPIDLRIIIGL